MRTVPITTVDQPDPATAAALARLVDAVDADLGPPVGERKRVQLQQADDAPWTALVAAAPDGAPVGYAHVRWEDAARGDLVASVEVAVHASDHALADRLVAAAADAVRAAGGGPWQLWAHHDVAAHAAERAGLALTRRLLLMHRRLDPPPPAPVLPEGVAVAALRDGIDDDALVAVNNAAFAQHPEQGGWTAADLAVRRAAPWYDPADVLLAWRGDDLLGFHWTKRHPPDQREIPADGPLGEVYVLAVRPDAQGLGLGRGLLRVGLAHLAGRGCADAALYVEADDPAARLYADEGFAMLRTHRCYVGGGR